MKKTVPMPALAAAARPGPARFSAPLPGLEDVRAQSLEVRLARDTAEIRAAQALRYRVFYEEMAAEPTLEMVEARCDFDHFDDFADHLLVIDHDHPEAAGAGQVVGTYRLLRRSAAAQAGQFYTADEFDISCLVDLPGEILELGRSCVDRAYRNRATMQLLWRGIASYVFHHDIELMFGCGSLPGTDPESLAVPLSYLYHHHLAPAALRPQAIADRFVEMDILEPDELDSRRALAELPPLIKGYLRLGGFVGNGAVVDDQFNTTDVCIVVKTDLVTEKYHRHYLRENDGRADPLPDRSA